MNKNLTELVFILDKSGSMSGLEADTIGGYNSVLEKQRNEKGKALVSTVLFNQRSDVIHDRVSIDKAKKMTEADYTPAGCTALLDAVGGAINHIGNIHKYARKEDIPSKTMFVIITDGMENASQKYDYAEVKKMISRQKKKYGWEFLFLGANIDAAEIGGRMGINRDRSVNYINDERGTDLNYRVLSDAVSAVRGGFTLSADWKADIEADEKKRRKP